MSAHLKKSLPIVRIAKLKSPAGREVLVRVTQDGRLGKRDAQHLGVKNVATWIEVEAKTWKQATKLVRIGKGKKVAP